MTRTCHGEIIDYCRPQNTTAAEVANGKPAITPETVLRLERYFGNGGGYWLILQTNHDLASTEREHGARLAVEVPAAA